jgi:hypothetical protein
MLLQKKINHSALFMVNSKAPLSSKLTGFLKHSSYYYRQVAKAHSGGNHLVAILS